jgi:hypothetical protein
MMAVVFLGHWAVETLGVGGKHSEFINGGFMNVIGGC